MHGMTITIWHWNHPCVSLGFVYHKILSAINNCGYERLHVHFRGLPNLLCMCSSIDFTFDFGVNAEAATLLKMWSVPAVWTADRDAPSYLCQFGALVCDKFGEHTWNTTKLGLCTSYGINTQSINFAIVTAEIDSSLQPVPTLVAVRCVKVDQRQ